MEQFLWFDVITLGLILILAIKGIINGFIKEVFGLIGIVGGIYIGARYASQAGDFISANIFAFENPTAAFLVGFLSILIIFWLFCISLGVILTKMLSLSGLGIVDKIAGFLVGGAKLFFIFSILFFIISNVGFVQEKLDKYLKDSFMYPAFIKTGAFIVDMKPTIVAKTKTITKTLEDNKSDLIESSAKVDQNSSTIESNETNLSQIDSENIVK